MIFAGEKTVKTNVDADSEPVNITTDSHSIQTENTGDSRTPLERFRPGYLWVSDLTRQLWCEQQMWYSFTLPGIVEENPVMTEGSNLHLARGMLYMSLMTEKCL